jgi:plastocyanin
MSNSNGPERRGGSEPPVSRRNVVVGAAFTALAVALGLACADDGPQADIGRVRTSNPADLPGTGQVVHIQSLDNTFRPDRVEIAAGTEVVWENVGRNDHDVLPSDGGDWGVDQAHFGPGATYSHVFTEPGEVSYYCSIHGTPTAGMVGTIVVTG